VKALLLLKESFVMESSPFNVCLNIDLRAMQAMVSGILTEKELEDVKRRTSNGEHLPVCEKPLIKEGVRVCEYHLGILQTYANKIVAGKLPRDASEGITCVGIDCQEVAKFGYVTCPAHMTLLYVKRDEINKKQEGTT
jgi:hypothetical protein